MNNSISKDDGKYEKRKVTTIDGGYGWVIVVICFLSTAVGDAMIFTYGAFYADLIDLYDDSISNVMIGGFLMLGLSSVIGPLGAALVNKFGFRAVMAFGAVTSSIAISGSSLMNSMFWFNIVLGFLGGTTQGFMLLCAYTMTPLWFDKKRSIACSIAYSGVGFGCIVYPVVIDKLISLYTIRGCILILGAINLNILVFAALVKEPHSIGKVEQITVLEIDVHDLNKETVYLSGEIFIPESQATYTSNHTIYSEHNHDISCNNHDDYNSLTRQGLSLTTINARSTPKSIKKIKSVIVSVTHRNGKKQCTDMATIDSSAFFKILEKSSKTQFPNENCNTSLMSLRSQLSDIQGKKFDEDLIEEISKPFQKSNLSIIHADNDCYDSQVHVTKSDIESPIISLLLRLLQPELFKNIAFWIIIVSTFLLTIILFAIPQTMRNYVDVAGFSRMQSSTFSITYGATTIVTKIAVGITVRFMKKSKLVYSISGLILAVATALIGIIPAYSYIIIYAIILGTATSNVVIMRYVITADYIPKKYLTLAYGWTFFIQGFSLIPALFIAEIGTEHGDYILSFVVNGIIAFAGSVALLFLYSLKSKS